MQSQETFNIGIVVNFLSFPTVTCMPKSDQENESYGFWNAARKCRNFSIDEKHNQNFIT
jgi:hypothetical protein